MWVYLIDNQLPIKLCSFYRIFRTKFPWLIVIYVFLEGLGFGFCLNTANSSIILKSNEYFYNYTHKHEPNEKTFTRIYYARNITIFKNNKCISICV